jgi:hypothetical protein
MWSLGELLFHFRLNLLKNVKMYRGLDMKKLFLRTIVLAGVLIVLGIFKPSFVQAQCFHLGQAFECNGLPEGTSSISFNPDGTLNLSNGQIVPGDFFNTPFRVQVLDVVPSDVVTVTPRPPITFFPTTADGINALTAFSHALDREDEYQQASLIFNKRLANRWLLRGNFTWQDWEWDTGGTQYDPELARQLLEEAGWVEDPSGERPYVPKETKLELTRSQAFEVDAHQTYQKEFLGGIEFEVARSVSLGVRYVHRTMPEVLDDPNRPVVPYDARYTKQALEYGIDQMDGNAAPIPILPFLPPMEPSSQTPVPFVQPGEPADNAQVM